MGVAQMVTVTLDKRDSTSSSNIYRILDKIQNIMQSGNVLMSRIRENPGNIVPTEVSKS